MARTNWCNGPQGFRPLLRGLVLADGGPLGDAAPSESFPMPWPRAFLAVAELCAAGQTLYAEAWHGALAQVVAPTIQEQILIELVVATPLLLINRNPYGHRRSVIQAWGQEIGLSFATQKALDDYFQRLGQPGRLQSSGHINWVAQSTGPGRGDPRRDWDRMGEMACPTFADLCALVDSLPGQWSLALTLAHRWGWPSAARALVGLLTISRAGVGGLPGLGHGERHLGPSWQGYTMTQMDALADALYQQWAGERPRSLEPALIMARDSEMT
ncbi:hypothetical protein GFS31_33400 [Leptolyngbya sp. BL0902]|uniref:hypothetical protein n=1 Tax=Leptolyngbya sp. BL0902 TaxID=1115757 RepID=UPI0018E8864B|nr:hypothetical protein [Leptolyngbya sp. BL0902]QQE66640.1 hypothetical protein GFS31_33400 [Leptolyngbya sp. BL0902]